VVVARDLRQVYKVSRGFLRQPAQLQAVGGVSFEVLPGKTLAVVGESGCGKSTLARMVSLIEPPTAAALQLAGVDVVAASPAQRHALRRTVQLVFQNPYGSLNPRKKIGAILEAPLEINTGSTPPQRAMEGPRYAGPGGACAPSTTTAIRTCFLVASASASPSRAR
jgi:dipeptide transport system ATP-binding protein